MTILLTPSLLSISLFSSLSSFWRGRHFSTIQTQEWWADIIVYIRIFWIFNSYGFIRIYYDYIDYFVVHNKDYTDFRNPIQHTPWHPERYQVCMDTQWKWKGSWAIINRKCPGFLYHIMLCSFDWENKTSQV